MPQLCGCKRSSPNIPTRPFIYATYSHTCHLQALPLTRGLHSEPCAPPSCLPVSSFVNVCELKSSDLPHTLGPLHVRVPADAPCQSPGHTRSLHYVCLRDVHTPSGALTQVLTGHASCSMFSSLRCTGREIWWMVPRIVYLAPRMRPHSQQTSTSITERVFSHLTVPQFPRQY